MKVLAIDVGTELSGFCLLDSDSLKPIEFGKIYNDDLLKKVKFSNYDELVYEEFQCYGMPIGASTIKSITWNGRCIQSAYDRGKKVDYIFRQEEKLHICHDTKAKDSNIRQALIDRFAANDLKNGKGTKKNPDFFYGFKADVWSAYAIGLTYIETKR